MKSIAKKEHNKSRNGTVRGKLKRHRNCFYKNGSSEQYESEQRCDSSHYGAPIPRANNTAKQHGQMHRRQKTPECLYLSCQERKNQTQRKAQ